MSTVIQHSDSVEGPYLTSAFPPISGNYKSYYDDFIVEEIPAYLPSGSGEHVYLHIEKRGISTKDAIQRLCRFAGIRAGECGAAGLKDARALTRQWISLRVKDESLFSRWDDKALRILCQSRHGNKLRIGHLKGNQFYIKLRHVPDGSLPVLQTVMDVLSKRGIPNYFGAQRFGFEARNPEVGRALLQQDFKKAAFSIVGNEEVQQPSIQNARTFFENEDWKQSLPLWPSRYQDARNLCRALIQSQGDYRKALYSLGMDRLWFYISAYQSYLFNRVLARRLSMNAWDQLWLGDLAFKHDSGAVFLVENPKAEQIRCDLMEISPSGPLFGFKMTEPLHEAGLMEQKVLNEEGMNPESFFQPGRLKCQGARRSLRFALQNFSIESGKDEKGGYAELKFALPAGCFATAVLREVGKGALKEGISKCTTF